MYRIVSLLRYAALLIYIMQDKQALVFHEEMFQLPVPIMCQEMIEDANIFLCFHKIT